MKRVFLPVLLLYSCLFMPHLGFGQNFDDVEITIQKLTDKIYMLEGRGGNIGVLVGGDGVVMVDDQYAPLSEKIKAAIKTISDQPVKFLLNTHWHGDHAGGNENFGRDGALIIAQKNVRKRLSTDQVMKAFSRTVPAAPEIAWPVVTFTEDMNLHLNGEDILLMHTHDAHTDGDAFVYFLTSNVIHMGDTYFNGRFPFIDIGSGGSVEGMIKWVNNVLFLINDETKIIPGHGPVSNKAELIVYRDVLQTLRDRVIAAIDKGQSIEEIKAANLASDYDEKWGQAFINGERIVDIIFTDLSRE